MVSQTSKKFQFGKNNPVSLRHHAYLEIRSAIIRGQLEPGTRLLEVELSEQMGISRGPIREAIRLLEQEGLVNTYPNRGSVVGEMHEDEMKDIIVPSRRNFELFAVLKASETFTEDDFTEFEQLIENMQEASDQDNLDLITELDVQFHSKLVERTVSPEIYRIWTSIAGKIHARILIQGYKKSTLNTAVEEHRELLSLIRKGDRKQLEKHLQHHII
jgi:DNA-binding GntR family transcriptional regulator